MSRPRVRSPRHPPPDVPRQATLRLRPCLHPATHSAAPSISSPGLVNEPLLPALLTDYVEGRHPTIQVLQTLQHLAKELHAIGVNLNQAARALNMGERPGRLTPLLQHLAIQVQAAHDRLRPYHVPRTP